LRLCNDIATLGNGQYGTLLDCRGFLEI